MYYPQSASSNKDDAQDWRDKKQEWICIPCGAYVSAQDSETGCGDATTGALKSRYESKHTRHSKLGRAYKHSIQKTGDQNEECCFTEQLKAVTRPARIH